MKSGVYLITNTATNQEYVGSSKNLELREKQHFSKLRRNDHCNAFLQNSYNKYGKESFTYTILIVCSEEDARYYEQQWLDKFDPAFNICKLVGVGNYITKAVAQYTPEGKFVKKFESIVEAADELGCSASSIGSTLTGQNVSCKGFLWTYADCDNYAEDIPSRIIGSSKGAEWTKFWQTDYVINKWSLSGEFLDSYSDLKSLVKTISVTQHMFCKHLHGEYGSVKGHVYTLNDEEPEFPNWLRNKAILEYSRKGELLNKFQTAKIAAEELGISYASLHDALTLRYGTNKAHDKYWKYDDGEEFKLVVTESNKKVVEKLNLEGEVISTFDSIRNASIEANTNRSYLAGIIKRNSIYKGFKYRYKL
jgi:hypothetical protein